MTTTATHITDDAALPYLARFADHAFLPVRSQLMWGWSRFDPARYAEEIITRLDTEDLRFPLVSDQQAAEVVRQLELRPGLSPDGVALLRETIGGAEQLAPSVVISV